MTIFTALGFDHTPARLALRKQLFRQHLAFVRMHGETHLARADNLYRGYRDYDGALA